MSLEVNKVSKPLIVDLNISTVNSSAGQEELHKTLVLFNNKKVELLEIQKQIQQALNDIERKKKKSNLDGAACYP